MGRFPAAVAHVSRRQVHAAAKHAVTETDRARAVLVDGVLPALKHADERVQALEATIYRGFWGRLSWLVLGR